MVANLQQCFSNTEVIDRRQKPSHGYRAVHVIVREDGVAIEVQIRTRLQDLWAQWSEKLSKQIDPSIKYGGGPPVIREGLVRASELVRRIEADSSSGTFSAINASQDRLELGATLLWLLAAADERMGKK